MYGGNYDWLYRLGCALLAEYRWRLGRIHAFEPVLRALEHIPPWLQESSGTWCDAPLVVPNEFEVGSVQDSYKNYYRKEKLGVLLYTRRKPPEWLGGVGIYQPITE
jgi:hypothetical protein